MANLHTQLSIRNPSKYGQRLDRLLSPLKLVWWTVIFPLRHGATSIRDRRLIAQSNVFDASFYVAQNPHVVKAGIDPLLHYLVRGGAEYRNPHPLFDSYWYSQQTSSELGEASVNPLAHYLRSGWKKGRSPHVLFDNSFYLEHNPDVAAAGINPLVHYLSTGWKEGRAPHPLFDTVFYLEQNPDVAAAGINPLVHYLSVGRKETRAPHLLFDNAFYLEQNPDVAAMGINPLVHYLSTGWKEGRSPHLLFDTVFYLEENRDVAATGINPLVHYLSTGWKEGRAPHPLFDSAFYLARNPDVAQAEVEPVRQYLISGALEGRKPHSLFDTSFYLAQNPDVAAAGINPLLHFIKNGVFEGRSPNPIFDPIFYYKNNPHAKQARTNALSDYLRRGATARGYDPGPLFNTVSYISKHPELNSSGINPLAHLLDSTYSDRSLRMECVALQRDAVSYNNLACDHTFSTEYSNSTTHSNIDLLVDLTESDLPAIGEMLKSLAADALGKVVSAATILLRPEILNVGTPIPAGWHLMPALHVIPAANKALTNASKADHHLLILLGSALPSERAVQELIEAFKRDPHFGIATGRQCDPSSGQVIGLTNGLCHREPGSIPRPVLDYVPEFYILPEILVTCFVVRDLLIATLGIFDECYATLPGALLDYLSHARRCGFRSVVVNRAVINSVMTRGELLERDILKLATEHPSVARAQVEFYEHSLHLHENLLALAVSPIRSVRHTLLVDTSCLSNISNGTSEAVLGICDGLQEASHDWNITLFAAQAPARFHKLAERYPNWKIIGPGDRCYFTASLLTQPWSIGRTIELHRMALFNFYTMLDTIGWDILPAATNLEATWNFVSEYADGILYISQYTRDHFATRFPTSRAVPACIAHLSLDPADYRVCVSEKESKPKDGFIFVVGNSYDHKHLRPTVDLLTSAFPLERIKVLGLNTNGNSSIDAINSGQIPQFEVDCLFAQARIVVFPSLYEGFGLPVLRGLSYGRVVVARHSELLLEIAARYRGPGRLFAFRSPSELVHAINSILKAIELPEVPLGTALQSAQQPAGWKESAAKALQFIEQQTANIDKSRWCDREKAVRQLTAYAE